MALTKIQRAPSTHPRNNFTTMCYGHHAVRSVAASLLDQEITNAQRANRLLYGASARGNMTLLTSMWKAGKTTRHTCSLPRGGCCLGRHVATGKSAVIRGVKVSGPTAAGGHGGYPPVPAAVPICCRRGMRPDGAGSAKCTRSMASTSGDRFVTHFYASRMSRLRFLTCSAGP